MNLMHHLWKQLVNSCGPRSVSADRTGPQMISKHFGKTRQDGETARQQDGKQPWNQWVAWNHMKSHEITRNHMKSRCGVIYMFPYVSLCFLMFPWDPLSRGVNTEPLPQRHVHALAKCCLLVDKSPWEWMRVNESPSPVICRTVAVSVVFFNIVGRKHALWYTLWSFMKWICFKYLRVISCPDEFWGASSGWTTSKDWWRCSLAALWKQFGRYMWRNVRISNSWMHDSPIRVMVYESICLHFGKVSADIER